MKLNKLESLTIDEITRGISVVLDNANSLIEDGNILLKERRFPRAYTLYQLATEEVGKSRLLYSLLIGLKTGEQIDYKDYNMEFVNHSRKSKGAIAFETIALFLFFGSEKDDINRNIFKEAYQVLQAEQSNQEQVNNNKNFSLYVSIINDCFITPRELITEQMTNTLRKNAIVRLKASERFFENMLPHIDMLVPKMKEFRDNPELIFDEDFVDLFSNKEDN